MTISQDEWIQFLNNYCIGELEGSNFIDKLPAFAPGKEEKEWVKKWAKEELYHHKLWSRLVKKQKIPRRKMDDALKKIYDATDRYVERKDWIGSMVSAAIIEHMGVSAAEYLFKHADPLTKRIFRIITGDDLAHIDFDIAQIAIAAKTKQGRRRIEAAHKQYMKQFLQWPTHPDVNPHQIRILNNAFQLHRLKMMRIGVKLPNIRFADTPSFRIKKALIETWWQLT